MWYARGLVLFTLLLHGVRAAAWVYPEHRYILLLAIQELGAPDRALLDSVWAEARMGHEGRLSAMAADVDQGRAPAQLDYAAWAAIAGDHSCSPADMLRIVLESPWVLDVADVAARLRTDLARAKRRDQTLNAVLLSDIRLLRTDRDYATRARSNEVHFLLARENVEQEAHAYFNACTRQGAPANAVGAYVRFHALALRKMAAAGALPRGPERSGLLLAALADEAFALHFLQDMYASGHVAGTWGDAAHRRGTHDHYNESGLEVQLWSGRGVVLTGDAFMRLSDAVLAAQPVRGSLEQLVQALRMPPPNPAPAPMPDTLDLCANTSLPPPVADPMSFANVLMQTPRPALPEGLGELPRFRSEMGPFVGFSGAVGLAGLKNGFGTYQHEGGAVGHIEANLMVGLGMDGVLNSAGDGLAFLQVGWRQDAASTQQAFPVDPAFAGTTLTSVIPGRSAYNLRLRMPFWLVPGDLLFTAPILGLASPRTYQRMAVRAANGGLLHLHSGVSTPLGRFQFVLGREVGVSFFGLGPTPDALFVPGPLGYDLSWVTYRSTRWEFPVLEYTPTRTFSQDQSATLKAQLTFGVDDPSVEEVLAQGTVEPVQLRPIWFIGARVLFNWRRYF